ncbi:unnamed protein product [Rhizophagus irregularis]|nr:unnamed protein product [Rhizophagus irregularis]
MSNCIHRSYRFRPVFLSTIQHRISYSISFNRYILDFLTPVEKKKTRDKYNRNKNVTLKPKSQLGTYRTLWIFNLRSVSMEGWN